MDFFFSLSKESSQLTTLFLFTLIYYMLQGNPNRNKKLYLEIFKANFTAQYLYLCWHTLENLNNFNLTKQYIFYFRFSSHLAASRPTLGHLWQDSFSHLMFKTSLLLSDSRITKTRVESLSLVEQPVIVDTATNPECKTLTKAAVRICSSK